MKRKKITILAIAALSAIGLSACMQEHKEETKQIGGTKDAHGCLTSAGYSWSEEKQACIRVWEEN